MSSKPSCDDALIEAARRQFLAYRAAGDDATRRTGRGAGLDARDSSASVTFSATPLPGYELVRERHRGGQGVVFEAIQLTTKRRVAIKTLLDESEPGASQRARFEREIEILSQFKHPNIVTIHDSGSTAGRMYYVMDLIDGQPLDRHMAVLRAAAEGESSPGGRAALTPALQLFVKICDAVNAAHLRGVIHRDLKPGNILIDAAGEPRVLDFGLAKRTLEIDEAAAAVSMTQPGQFVGSLPWSSPEQASGAIDQIDTRTDVYALGVLLYHTLTGRFPYKVVGTISDVVQQIRTAEPAPLRIESSSGRGWRIDDELETIVRKALQKDPARRYQTAGDLGRDLTRYLNHEPIEAKRDSFGYVLRKHLRRHRLAVGAAAGVVAALAVGLGVSLYFWRQAELQRQAAEKETQRALAAEKSAERRRAQAETATRLIQGMFGSIGDSFRGRDITVQQMLDLFAEDALKRAAREPELEIPLRSVLSSAYLALGRVDRAAPHLQRGFELVKENYGESSLEYATALNKRATLNQYRGKYPAAEADYRAALELCGGDDPQSQSMKAVVQYGLASVLKMTGRFSEAESYARAAVEGFRTLPDERDKFGAALRSYGALLADLERDDEAEALLKEAIEVLEAELGPGHPSTAAAWNDYADFLRTSDRPADAIPWFEKAQATFRETHGDESAAVATCMGNLGVACMRGGQPERARELLTESLALRRKLYPALHVEIATGLNNLAAYHELRGDYAAAIPLYREACEILKTALPARHPNTLGLKVNLARTLLQSAAEDDAAEAQVLLGEVIDLRRRELPADHPEVVNLQALRGLALLRDKQWTEAERVLTEVLEVRAAALPPNHWLLPNTRSALGEALLGQGRIDEARPLIVESFAALRVTPDASPPRLRDACERVVRLYEAAGETAQAEEARAACAKLP